MSATTTRREGNDLILERIIDATPDKVFRAWTDPKVMVEWFAPKPWTTKRAEIDARAGGTSLVVMADPEGNEFPNPGVYLEVVPNKKIVFTDAYTDGAWTPAEGAPFMTGILTFEDAGAGKTKYTARLKHWTKEACDQHEEMGFHQGWAQCAEQLAETVAKL